MKESKIPKKETLALVIGEAAVSLIISAVYLLLKKFDYTVALGVILGSVITLANFIFLSLSVSRALEKAMAGVDTVRLKAAYEARDRARETEDDGDEEKEEDGSIPDYERLINDFESERQKSFNASVKLSYLIRNVSMIIALVVAFLTKQFDVIATLIPLLMLRPILTVAELCGRKEN
jgi:hypothetical protein